MNNQLMPLIVGGTLVMLVVSLFVGYILYDVNYNLMPYYDRKVDCAESCFGLEYEFEIYSDDYGCVCKIAEGRTKIIYGGAT